MHGILIHTFSHLCLLSWQNWWIPQGRVFLAQFFLPRICSAHVDGFHKLFYWSIMHQRRRDCHLFEDSSDNGQCRIPIAYFPYYEGARNALYFMNAYWVVTWDRFSARLALNVDMEIRCQRCWYRTSRSSAWGCCILLGNSWVQISVGKPTLLTGFCVCDFSQSLPAYARKVLKIMSRRFPSTSLTLHSLILPSDAI
jgi:hypothetical protein